MLLEIVEELIYFIQAAIIASVATDVGSSDLMMHRHAVLLGLALDGVEEAPAGTHARYIAHALIVVPGGRSRVLVMMML